MTNPTGIVGNHAENLALKYLQRKKLTLIESNFFCRHGEIDLVMQDSDYLVFVEVRHRKSNKFGGAIASIDVRKQNKLRRSAEYYLIKHKKTDSPCRFDILCVDGNLSAPNYDWIHNAF